MLKNYRLSCFGDLTINALISIILFAQLSEMVKNMPQFILKTIKTQSLG